jgi:uncharacterized protein (DUF342 family)
MAEGQKTQRLKLVVSADRMKAWLQVLDRQSEAYVPPTEEEVWEYLGRKGFPDTDENKTRVAEVLQACQTPIPADVEKPENAFLIAAGQPPVDAVDGRFEWAPEYAERLRKPDEDEQIDYFAQNAIVTVAKETVVGTIVDPEESVPGVDVFGKKVQPSKPKGRTVKLGPGMERVDPDDGPVHATSDGRVAEENGTVRLFEVLDIPGDVDFSSGCVDAVIDVHVRGTIRGNFSVKTTKNLTVDKLVEPSVVEVGEDVSVRGGIFGREGQGYVKAGGSVTASFVDECRLQAKGDFSVNKEMLNSLVRVQGKLLAERGTVIGGDLYARGGMEVHTIGSDAGVPTRMTVGTDVNALRRARQMEKQVHEMERSAENIRETLKPLMANLRRLLPQQREKVTELMCNADEIDLKISDTQDARAALLDAAKPTEPAYILVHDSIFPGTHLVVEAHEVHVQTLMRGPIRIEMRKVKGATQVVAVNQQTGSVTVLPAVSADLDVPPIDEEWTHDGPIESADAESQPADSGAAGS